jgi:hypothetical protein
MILVMAGVEHVYEYLAPSAVSVASGQAEVTLATSGGKAPHPFFESGPARRTLEKISAGVSRNAKVGRLARDLLDG